MGRGGEQDRCFFSVPRSVEGDGGSVEMRLGLEELEWADGRDCCGLWSIEQDWTC